MVKRSKGIKRITLLISVSSTIGWISFVGIVSDGFSGIHNQGWLIFVGVLSITCFVPLVIYKAVYWVIDGFREDKTT